MLLKKQGNKTVKIELFKAGLFQHTLEYERLSGHGAIDMSCRYRLRMNGRWYPKNKVWFLTKCEYRDILFRSISFNSDSIIRKINT